MTSVEEYSVVLSARGIRVRILDWGGDGPLALLSHANGFCAGTWAPLAEHLATRFRVLAFDARGHGESSKPEGARAYAWGEFVLDLIALTERLLPELSQPQVAFAIGHSFGATATLEAAARRPDLFARIGLLDPVLVPPPDQGSESLAHRVDLADAARKRRQIWASRDEVRSAWRDREPFRDWDPRVFELYLQEGLRDRSDGRVELSCPREIEAAIYEANDRPDPFSAARRLSVPGLLVWAARGNFPRPFYEQVTNTGKTLRLVDVDAGHLLPMIAPETVGKLLLAFGSET